MNNNASKGRKRRKYSDLDDSRKSIKVFCVEDKADKNIKGPENILRASFEICENVSKVIPNSVGRKKQTLLAPFDQTTKPNCFKIKKMDSWKEGEKSKSWYDIVLSANCNNSGQVDKMSAGCSSGEDRDSEFELVKCCEKAEELLSTGKSRNGDIRSKRSCHNATKVENIVDECSPGSDSELEIIECCERAELSLSQEKRKLENDNRRPNACHNNVTPVVNVNGCSSSVESDSELEIIECCERAELSLSQEKRKLSKDNCRSNAKRKNVTQVLNVNGFSSKEEKESELEIIKCCERAELTLSQQKRRQKFSGKTESNEKYHVNNANKVRRSNIKTAKRNLFTSKASAAGSVNGKVKLKITNHTDEFEIDTNDLDIVEVCKQVELSENQASSDNVPVDTANSIYSLNMFGLFGVTSSDEEMDSCFDGEMEYYCQRSYFDEMPDEMLENIFCQLPLIDLLASLSLVCKRWYRIISSEKFLLWKKRYYHYKYYFDSRREIDNLLAEAQLHIPPVFPSQLCR